MLQARKIIFWVKRTATPSRSVNLSPDFCQPERGWEVGEARGAGAVTALRAVVCWALSHGRPGSSVHRGRSHAFPTKGRADAEINSVAYALHL